MASYLPVQSHLLGGMRGHGRGRGSAVRPPSAVGSSRPSVPRPMSYDGLVWHTQGSRDAAASNRARAEAALHLVHQAVGTDPTRRWECLLCGRFFAVDALVAHLRFHHPRAMAFHHATDQVSRRRSCPRCCKQFLLLPSYLFLLNLLISSLFSFLCFQSWTWTPWWT